MLALMSERRVSLPGEILCEEGVLQLDPSMFVVHHGALDVSVQRVSLCTVREGEWFGAAVMTGGHKKHFATLKARNVSMCLVISQRCFFDAMTSYPKEFKAAKQMQREELLRANEMQELLER